MKEEGIAEDAAEAAASSQPAGGGPCSPWVIGWNSKHRMTYWQHSMTGNISWSRPKVEDSPQTRPGD
eukprot:14282604-Alexandrium_andersonii.AAC.1